MSTDTPDLFDAPNVPASATTTTSPASAAPSIAPAQADEADTRVADTGADQPPRP